MLQIADNNLKQAEAVLKESDVQYTNLGKPIAARKLNIVKDGSTTAFDIDAMRNAWYETSYELDTKQSFNGCAAERRDNIMKQPLQIEFPEHFKGTLESYGISADRRTPSGIKAAIIREKGTNGEREMAYSLYLAGFDVKDVTMTDLISGRETLEDVNMIVYCGGFSNSDVLGSAKGCEALREDDKPLYVLCIGAITNIASAIQACPDIVPRMTVVWIGGQSHEHSTGEVREFNAGNDIEAANLVLGSGVRFWQIPNDVYGSMRISLAEIQMRVAPCGEIGKHLFEQMETYNRSERAGWTPGESWTLGDSPAVGVVMDEFCGKYHETEAPVINEDTTNRFESGRPKIRVYTSIDPRFIVEDFIAKLQCFYGGEES